MRVLIVGNGGRESALRGSYLKTTIKYSLLFNIKIPALLNMSKVREENLL